MEHFRSFQFIEYSCSSFALMGYGKYPIPCATSEAILPYDPDMHRLWQAYFQQGEYGKQWKYVTDRRKSNYTSWSNYSGSSLGPTGSMRFIQLIHQDTLDSLVIFLPRLFPTYPIGDHHQNLLSNFFASGLKALMKGTVTFSKYVKNEESWL